MKTIGTLTFPTTGSVSVFLGYEPTYVKAIAAGRAATHVNAIRWSEGISDMVNQSTQTMYDGGAGIRTELVDGKIVSLLGNVGGGSIGESLAVEIVSSTPTGIEFNVLVANDTTPVLFEFEG